MMREMIEHDLLTQYLGHFDPLIGDRRTARTFEGIVRGIINGGSLVCQQIAAHSSVLSTIHRGAQRVIRFAKGTTTTRSQVDAEHLVAALCQRGVAQLGESGADELWLIADLSDLRKPYAREMPDLMEVRDLNGKPVPGYRTVNVLALTPGRRGILYHRLFSSQSAEFVSEPVEVQRALQRVSEAVEPLKERMAVSWIVDRGFDDVAVWRTIWEQGEHVVCRIYHTERLVAYQTPTGKWREGHIEAAQRHLRPMATAQTEMVVRRGRQRKEKRQEVTVALRACPLRLAYDTQVRREGEGEMVDRALWLVEVSVQRSPMKPWLVITDWPVEDAEGAVRIFRMYRQRWAVEDSFKFTKGLLGWEEVQLLDLEGIRTLLALAWVAAGYLYELGVTLEWEAVRLLARLGGWAERKDNPPGKIVLTRGLRRVVDMLVTQAVLDQYRQEHGALPPTIAAWLSELPPDHLWQNLRLRRTSLDEAPQFWNVLMGDMSLVGPRPEEARIVQLHYNDWHRQRLALKPGMTGPMQINGRAELSLDERIQLELAYVQEYSLKADIRILIRTLPALLTGRGAY